MPVLPRPRWPGIRSVGTAALTVALSLLVSGCGQYPNSVFHSRTDFNRDTDWLFQLIIWLGTIVFVLVEALLVWVVFKYRAKPGQPEPKHVHGNTTLEIAWTVIPALILLVIAVPTVKSIFRTQAPAVSSALQVEVIGHQWWWEFKYPQYTTPGANGRIDTLSTANELYLPLGRTANFALKSADVIHSFWIPAMGGKRDLMKNRTNYLWFTPDSTTANAWNGVCVEYCGESHANMRFRAFTVSPEDFEAWAAHMMTPAKVLNAPAAPAGGATPPGTTAAIGVASVVGGDSATAVQAGFTSFPLDKIELNVRSNTTIPAGLTFDETLKGDPLMGEKLVSGQAGPEAQPGACLGCHTIKGNPMMVATLGPNLSHLASRTSIGAGLFTNDAKTLGLWIKNARLMKPGILMPTLGKGQVDPPSGKVLSTAVLTDQQIADIVAYLQTLK
jgi:cytochrome c oxidase subunit 2